MEKNEKVDVWGLIAVQTFLNPFGAGFFMLKKKVLGIICIAVLFPLGMIWANNKDSSLLEVLYMIPAIISVIVVGILAHQHNKKIDAKGAK
jgi:Na+/H+-dicarboxylate symporter